MNGSCTQFVNLMRFPQLGPISHSQWEVDIPLRPSSHTVNICIKVKGVRRNWKQITGRRQQWPSGTHWLCTGSQCQQHPHLNHFSPPAAAREAASCALCAIWPEEQIPKRNLKYTMKFILAMKAKSQKGFSLITKEWRQLFLLVCVLICSKWQFRTLLVPLLVWSSAVVLLFYIITVYF